MLCKCGCGETPDPDRLWVPGHHRRTSGVPYLVDDNGCWVWQRARSPRGYGLTFDTVARRQVRAHTVYYEQAKGPVPKGLMLDHLCRNPPCVNPDHLEPVTNAVNAQRGGLAKLTQADVFAIRLMHATTTVYGKDIADLFGVSKAHVSRIVNGKTWL